MSDGHPFLSQVLRLVVFLMLFPALLPGPRGHQAAGQAREALPVRMPSGDLSGIPLQVREGVAFFQARELARLGWSVAEEGVSWSLRRPEVDGAVEILPGNPFFRWGREGVHLAHPPVLVGQELHLPLQFLVDVLPWKLPQLFRWNEDALTLELTGPAGDASHPPPIRLLPPDSIRVVVIDAGHGGIDPGARGRGGTSEKDVALQIAQELARLLRAQPNLEVHLTRDRDELIPLWQRGELATTWKGDRPGVFVSIHANALPNSRSTRGFETYFLGEANNEHARRTAALENASMEFEDRAGAPGGNPDLSFILTDLLKFDHQHWSALLAELVQKELAEVHPGTNRGVKQGPLAVITNALMPAVLVEVGFLSNQDEERLLRQKGFQQQAATAVAEAVLEFFRRYPPVSGGAQGRDEGVP